jgi:hypothetical protein
VEAVARGAAARTCEIQHSCRLAMPVTLSCTISLARPESTTKRTPSMVTDVSAMFVDRMHLLERAQL